MAKFDLIKKYSDMNWDGWPSVPSEEIFTYWLSKRVARKKGNWPSPRAMSGILTQIKILHETYQVTAETAFEAAEDRGWDSIKSGWVLGWIQRNREATAPPVFSGGVVAINSSRSTRDIGLEEELNDGSWANNYE